MRVLGRIRLSRLTEESTSAQRQRELIEQWADANDHTIVGWAEDLDISGSVDPWDTPALGPWLTQPKLAEWDILCAWKLDRLARRAVPLHKLFGLCQDEGKTLVCVSDNIDLSHWVGRLVASVIAGVAEGELESIRERTKASHRKLRELGRWPGGRPTYGYMAQERTDAAGWELVADPVAFPILRRIVDDFLDGIPAGGIAKELTNAGVLPPSQHLRANKGQTTKLQAWTGQSILQILRSKTLLGHVTHQGVTVRDSDGNPVRKGPAVVTPDEFDRIQAILASRSTKKHRADKTSPVLGVAVCWDCGNNLYLNTQNQKAKKKVYRYYSCKACKGALIPAEWVETDIYETFLNAAGNERIKDRVYVPASDHTAELAEAVRAIDELTQLLATVTSATVKTRLFTQIDALDKRIKDLEGMPQTAARWEQIETPETYGEVWENAGTEQRRQLLLKSGIKFRIKRHPGTNAVIADIYRPFELLDNLSQ